MEGVDTPKTNEKENRLAEESNDEELKDEYKKVSRCGCGSCTPNWLQKLASKKVFLIVYGLMGLNHSAFANYFNGTISTMEKRFKLPSASFGLINSAWDVGGITASLFIAYFGSSGSRAKWVGCLALLPALGCFLRYFPHYYLGPVVDFSTGNMTTNSTVGRLSNDPLCLGVSRDENCSVEEEGLIALVVLFVAHLISGLGTAAYWTLGASFLDDNVPKNKFPLLLGMVTTLRFIGPAVGFTLVSYALNQYVDPSVEPWFGVEDARWIGAWHMGWIPFGCFELVAAFAMSLFPRWLPREACRRQKANLPAKWDGDKQSFQDFKNTMKRIFKNKIIVLNTISSSFFIFGLMGYWIFMPKYIETQFRLPASTASVVTGSVGLVCTAAGVLTSGAVISKFKPRPIYLAAWNVFVESFEVIGRASFAFIGCAKDNIHGSYSSDGSWNLTAPCNAECDCSINLKYAPVCSAEGVTYYSPCHAGCLTSTVQKGVKTFLNCSCLPEASDATDGPCPSDCGHQFIIFLGLLCVMNFLSASGRSGNTIIQYRSVDPKDKSVAIAMSEVVLSAFTFIPSPVFFGAIIDSSCLVWGYTCGKIGNCWFYSDEKMRYLLNFTSAGFLFIGMLFDVGVMCNVGSLQIYDTKDVTIEKRDTEMKAVETPLLKEEDKTNNEKLAAGEVKEGEEKPVTETSVTPQDSELSNHKNCNDNFSTNK